MLLRDRIREISYKEMWDVWYGKEVYNVWEIVYIKDKRTKYLFFTFCNKDNNIFHMYKCYLNNTMKDSFTQYKFKYFIADGEI